MATLRLLTTFLSLAACAQAGFSTSGKGNLVVYWGQNSAGQQSTQTRLSDYCSDSSVDVILLAFMLRFNGPGGQPVMNFANQGDKCSVFPGTQTFSCPEMEADIQTCQSNGKTIMLSIGGDTYTEGGFSSPDAAKAAAEKTWATFGPVQSGSGALRPFGDAVLDGFDFDFESIVSNMGAFGSHLRSLMDGSSYKKYFLSAAPQCPFPDAYDKDIMDSVALDFVNVQFYNNPCGASSFVPGAGTQPSFNFNQWDAWARTSKNPNVKVLLGVPASTGAGRGYLSPDALRPVIQNSAQYQSFGGVMMWDASQAWTNNGFVTGVRATLASLAKRDASEPVVKRTMRWGLRAKDE